MTIDGANIIFRYPFNIDDIDDCVQFIKSEFENMKIEALSCVVVLRKTKNEIYIPNKYKDYYFPKCFEDALDDLEIKTLESIDLGIAFIVKVEDKTIYHAGDLNWWHWEGENTPEENKFAEDKFKSAIDKIKGENIDVAFLPLDSRQGNQYYLGFDYFMRNTNTKVAFPMHFFRAYSLSKIFKDSEYASTYKDKIIDINKDSQTFEL